MTEDIYLDKFTLHRVARAIRRRNRALEAGRNRDYADHEFFQSLGIERSENSTVPVLEENPILNEALVALLDCDAQIRALNQRIENQKTAKHSIYGWTWSKSLREERAVEDANALAERERDIIDCTQKLEAATASRPKLLESYDLMRVMCAYGQNFLIIE